MNTSKISTGPDLLAAARAVLANFEGAAPEMDPTGEKWGGAWQSLEELRTAVGEAAEEN